MSDLNTDGCYEPGADDFKGNFTLLEKGVYFFVIKKAEIKETKKGNGNYLNVEFQVIEGEREDTCVFKKFNLNNPNAKAVAIGKRHLAGLKHAVKIPDLSNEQEFVGCRVWGEVVIKPGNAGYPDQNDVGNFKSADWKPEEFNEAKSAENSNKFSDTEKTAF